MTRDDIIGMAREAGIDSMPVDYNYRSSYYAGTSDEIERFAALVAAAEREACAKVCDQKVDAEYATGKVDHNEMGWTQACAIAIRARGQA
jgi:hypothetical protein